MAIGATIFDMLNLKLGFETDSDDPLVTYKEIILGKT
jgi:hypothetical protein